MLYTYVMNKEISMLRNINSNTSIDIEMSTFHQSECLSQGVINDVNHLLNKNIIEQYHELTASISEHNSIEKRDFIGLQAFFIEIEGSSGFTNGNELDKDGFLRCVEENFSQEIASACSVKLLTNEDVISLDRIVSNGVGVKTEQGMSEFEIKITENNQEEWLGYKVARDIESFSK